MKNKTFLVIIAISTLYFLSSFSVNETAMARIKTDGKTKGVKGKSHTAATSCKPPNATGVIDSKGRCVIAKCIVGYGDCDRNSSNGCETKMGTITNCGKCGNKCEDGVFNDWECKSGKCYSRLQEQMRKERCLSMCGNNQQNELKLCEASKGGEGCRSNARKSYNECCKKCR